MPGCGVVPFDYVWFGARFPEFAGLLEPTAEAYWDAAGDYLPNNDHSPVQDLARRKRMLGLIAAHIAALSDPKREGLVGRISNASEGSVSVAVDMGTQSAQAAFFMQTPYGVQFWQATANLRIARYIPAPSRGFGRRFF